MCKDKNKNTKSDSNNKSKDSSSKSRIGENLKAQERIQKVYELRPKVDPKPKNK